MKPVKLSVCLAAALLVGSLAAGCGSSSSAAGDGSGGKVNLVAYSTPQPAYAKLIPAFQSTPQGGGTSFTQSYGASGDQSRAVDAGQAADVVHFALEPDIKRLVDDHLVPSSWDQNQYHGIVANSTVVFAVRPGNPKHITSWDDLVKPGVQVITPNPFTSGGARWNIMAAYGAQIKEGKTPALAIQFLNTLFHHVAVQDDKASASLQTFVGGKGDVLLAYEQDAMLAKQAGESLDIVYPKDTILIQTPLATTTKSSAAGKAFAKWMWSTQAQTILGENGYRPVVSSVAEKFASTYPAIPGMFTIDELGGWDNAMTKFFDPTSSVMQRIEQSLGVSTSG